MKSIFPAIKVVALTRAALMLSLLACGAFAQDKDWRPVDPADLKSEKPLVEADADVEALFWDVSIDDSSGDDLDMRHYVRVKIFTERGRERYSKFDIPYFKGLKIKDLAARVIRKDGSIVEIGKAEIFDREIVRGSGLKVKAKSFAVPNIEPGVIVEYRYKESYDDYGANGLKLDLQRDIPVQSLNYYYKPLFGTPMYKAFNDPSFKFVKDKGGFYLASRSNVPAFKQEPFMPPDGMVKPWVRLGSSRLAFGGVFNKFALARYLRSEAKDLKKTAIEITSGAKNDDEKIQKLYDYCQKQISNTSFDPRITDELRRKLPEVKSLKDVIKRGSASSQYIDMLFGALAIASDLDARVAFLGDRSRMFTSVENIDQDFMHPGAIGIKLGDNWRFYNPGTKFLPMGKLVWYEEAGAAQLVSETQWDNVNTPYSDHNYTYLSRTGKFELLENGTLQGEITIERYGHLAVSYRMENYDESPSRLEENVKDDVLRKISSAEITAISIENLTDISKPVVHRYRVKIPNYALKTGKRLLFQPGYFEYGSTPLFSSSTRQYDMFFQYPWGERDSIELTFPSNYAIDSGEAPKRVADRNNVLANEVQVSIDPSRSTLSYKRDFYFGGQGNVLFAARFYPAMKYLWDNMHKADTHQFSLKQK